MEINKTSELGKKFIEMVEEMSESTGQTPNEIIQAACNTAGVKIPKYKSITALYDFKKIKENDTLIFDTGYTKLNNGDIYLFNFSVLDKVYLLYGEYNLKFNSFILDNNGKKALKNDKNIEILGVLTHIEREL